MVTAFNGGGIRIDGVTANVTINNTTFDDNSSQAGGAICITNGTLNINGCCFNNNFAQDSSSIDGGGAIFIWPSAGITNVTISNSSFSNNQATTGSADGGAVSIKNNSSSANSTILFDTCSFTNNNCADRGEDVYMDRSFTPAFDYDLPAAQVKFEGLTVPTGSSANGDIVADGAGVPIDKPEFNTSSGGYTEISSSLPTSLPVTKCIDRFDGVCGTASATITCVTENKWDGSSWSKG